MVGNNEEEYDMSKRTKIILGILLLLFVMYAIGKSHKKSEQQSNEIPSPQEVTQSTSPTPIAETTRAEKERDPAGTVIARISPEDFEIVEKWKPGDNGRASGPLSSYGMRVVLRKKMNKEQIELLIRQLTEDKILQVIDVYMNNKAYQADIDGRQESVAYKRDFVAVFTGTYSSKEPNGRITWLGSMESFGETVL